MKNTCEQCGQIPIVVEIDYSTKFSICYVTVECACGKLAGPMNEVKES